MVKKKKPELDFYDVAAKQPFKSADWRIEERDSGKRITFFAVTQSPHGDREIWRIVKKDFVEEYA